ncbi:hypothetical protein MGN70_005616 [Eutypa lata]|nr:hypothetical protein MGN70_005616 [Eutypa lata]
MAHSPLFRTIMRAALDSRTASLTKYELAMEEICTDRLGQRHSGLLDVEGWHDYRKSLELKKPREARLAKRARDLWRGARRDDPCIKKPLSRPLRYQTFEYPEKLDSRAMAELPLARSIRYLKMLKMMTALDISRSSPVFSAYCDWRPPPRREVLRAEAVGASLVPSRRRGTPANPLLSVASGNDEDVARRMNCIGILDPWVLRLELTPEYVPKLHLRRERANLMTRSAEFAALVKRRVKKEGWRLPVAEGGYSDDDSDATEDESVPRNSGKRKRRAQTAAQNEQISKRQRNAAERKTEAKKQKEMPKPKPKFFVRTFDSRAHDERQLRQQARSRFALSQQNLPRVEQPLWGAGRYEAEEEGEEEGEEGEGIVIGASGLSSRSASDEGEEEEEEEAGGKTKKSPKLRNERAKPKEKKVSPYSSTEEEAAKMSEMIGFKLPTVIPDDYNWRDGDAMRLDGEEEEEGEEVRLTGAIGPDEAREYRRWRKTSAKAVFAARNRYTRCRAYKERTREKEITLTVREMLKFWKNRV